MRSAWKFYSEYLEVGPVLLKNFPLDTLKFFINSFFCLIALSMDV